MGWPGGLAIQLAFIAALAVATIRIEQRRHGMLEAGDRITKPREVLHRLLFGQWPLLWGALALAIVAASFSALMLTSITATFRPAFPPVPVGADIALVADRSAASLPVLTLSVVPAVRTALAVVNVISGAGIIEVVVPAVISVVVIGVAVISGARNGLD